MTAGQEPRTADVAAELEADPEGFAARAAAELEDADSGQVLAWAGRTFGTGRDGLVVTAAMGDTVLAHLAGRAVPGVDVLFVDTGYHFAETLGTLDAVRATYPVTVRVVRPAQDLAAHEAARGVLHRTDPDACCAVRKVAPLDAGLSGYRAWATGLRRDESPTRAGTPVVGWDARRRLVKLAPLARWTDDDVAAYLAVHPDVLLNPLLQLGYRSIGCAPCTRAVAPGEDARAGRWAGTSKTECGIHR